MLPVQAQVRVTGVVVENGRVLVLDQDTDDSRSVSLPGGAVEAGERLEVALVRELREETGLDVELGRLLYVCDHITDAIHVVHITFEARVTGGRLGDVAGVDRRPIRGVAFVPVDQLVGHGFSQRFADLVTAGFPDAGRYAGPKSAIGL